MLRRLEPVIARRAPEVTVVIVKLTVTPEAGDNVYVVAGIGKVNGNVALYAREKRERTVLAGAVASLLPPGTVGRASSCCYPGRW